MIQHPDTDHQSGGISDNPHRLMKLGHGKDDGTLAGFILFCNRSNPLGVQRRLV
jgi:hypothetical protein